MPATGNITAHVASSKPPEIGLCCSAGTSRVGAGRRAPAAAEALGDDADIGIHPDANRVP
jgi:hypothetical protein